jgi:pyruvate kinase
MLKQTKIVATLGLVSDTKETLRAMVENGMNVARLNFSHGSYEWHGNVIKIVRELAQEMNVSVGILADLQGPRIRTAVDVPVEMKKGEIIFVSDIAKQPIDQQGGKKILLDVENIIDDIEIGNEILIEDGLMKVVVNEKSEGSLVCEVIDGGTVKNHKGVNIPDAKLKIAAITEKDERDLAFVLKEEVDFVAMSFVSSGENIEELRNRIKTILGREDSLPQIIAKIERKEAIRNLDDIINHADAVMVARGDLGIEIEGTKVAVLQKEIVRKSLQKMKPVIVATQMLDSMIVNPRPTRAEISDVTNAVVDHADAVMLSGESAGGKYPVESVRTMRDIIRHTEASPFDDVTHLLKLDSSDDFKNLVKSAFDLARNSDSSAIVLTSVSGFTARMMSHFRSTKPLFVATNNEKTYHQLSLVWGAKPYYTQEKELSKVLEEMITYRKTTGALKDGDKVIAIFGSNKDSKEKMQMVGVKTI